MVSQLSHRKNEVSNLMATIQPLACNPSGQVMVINEEVIKVAGVDLQVFKMGVGNPLLLLHGLEGNLVRNRFVRTLAKHFTLYMPTHPGFGKSGRPFWIESPTDLAAFYTWYLEVEELEHIPVIGCSLGGQIVAEILAITGHAFNKAMLVGPGGLGPMYYHNPKLTGMLARVSIPTHIVWGANDTTIPVKVSDLYHQIIPGSRLTVIEESGHNPHKDQPEEFLKVAMDFLGDLC